LEHGAGSHKLVTRELASISLWNYKKSDGTREAVNYKFLCVSANANRRIGTGFFRHKEIRAPLKREKFVSGRTSLV